MAVNELLAAFHEIASSPKKQLDHYLAMGKEVIACAPIYIPEEIIHSMGLVPMGVWGADTEIKEAKRYFPAFICGIMQSILELGIQGKYQGISALVVPSLCDSLKCLGQNWKYGVADIPFIPVTCPQNRKEDYGKNFTKAGYERMIADLEVATKAKFSEAALTKSIVVYNEHNRVMRELDQALADHPSITASQRSDIYKSAWFLLKEEHTEMVRNLLAEIQSMPPEENHKIKVITSGILADNQNLLDLFETNGLQIVADDVAEESRQYRVDTPESGNPMDALAQKFADMDHCSVLYDPDKKRPDYIVDLVKKTHAAGVVILMTKFCDPEEFDYVLIKKACEAADIPTIQIEVDRQMGSYEQAGTMIQTFKEILA
ncbi:MAG: 2-hydroxyacyl-CoA dehydratase family protein [Hungatella sp.]